MNDDAPLPRSTSLRRLDEHDAPSPRRAMGRAPQGGAGPAPGKLTPRFFWWVFTRSWPWVVPTGLALAALVGAGLWAAHVPLYEANGLIRIENRQAFIAFQQGLMENSNQQFVRTQIELLRSPVVLREVVADERVGRAAHLRDSRDRVRSVQKNLIVRQLAGSELYEVVYVAPSPEEARDVVAAVIKHYFARQSDETYRRSQRVIELLEKERARRQLEVERLQQHVVGLAQEVKGVDPFANKGLSDVGEVVSPVATLHNQLADVGVKIEVLRAELQSIEEMDVFASVPSLDSGALDLEVSTHPEVLKRKDEIARVTGQMRDIEAVSKQWQLSRNRQYRGLADTLAGADAELAAFESRLRQQLGAEAARARAGGTGPDKAAETRRELAALQIQERSIRARYEKAVSSSQDGGGKSAELQFALGELEREEKVFEMIASRKLALQTEAKAPARVEVLDEVTASPVPVESAPWKPMLAFCTLAMVAPLGLAVTRETLLRRVTDADQLYDDTRLRVLGEVAKIPEGRLATSGRRMTQRMKKDMYAFAESIDALRMSLTFSAPREERRVIAVTSAVPGEGKTSVAVSLAMSYAKASGEPTLLIDGDMRRSGMARVIEVREGPGLGEVLAGKITVEEAVQPVVRVPGLDLLADGDCGGAPQLLAKPERFAELVDRLRERYRTIIIDTPPVLGASESLALCRAADLVALCTLRGVSRTRQVRIAMDKLEASSAPVAGTVLSGIPTRGYGYAYSYGYGYGHQSDRPTGRELSTPDSPAASDTDA